MVAANFVTIDLGGWVIAGNGTGSGVRTQGTRHNIAVRDGAVTGFDNGVSLGALSVVERVRASVIGDGVGISTGGDSIVTGNTSSGIFAIAAGDGSIVSGNIAGGVDIGITTGNFSTVSGNNASAEDTGISAGLGSTVSGNTASGELSISARPGSTVSGNTVAGFNGISAGIGSTVSGNTASATNPSEGTGIEAVCPSNVIGNTATGYESNLVLSGAGCRNIDNLAP